MEWIKCSERMPEKDEKVLLLCANNEYIWTAFFGCNQCFYNIHNDNYSCKEFEWINSSIVDEKFHEEPVFWMLPTHDFYWMPILQPPKE